MWVVFVGGWVDGWLGVQVFKEEGLKVGILGTRKGVS